jgi:Fe-S cluster biosynthesis and repair protein YggX
MTTNVRLVKCAKLKREAPGLDIPTYPGELGEKIYHHISEEAWNGWLEYLTMFINEGRLAVDQPNVKEMLKKEMIDFLNLDSIE